MAALAVSLLFVIVYSTATQNVHHYNVSTSAPISLHEPYQANYKTHVANKVRRESGVNEETEKSIDLHLHEGTVTSNEIESVDNHT